MPSSLSTPVVPPPTSIPGWLRGWRAPIHSALLALLVSGCGGKTTPPPVTTTPGSDLVAGNWQWSHQSDKKAVRRIELERWNLRQRGEQVRGHYVRKVTFLSLDGEPFRCNQELSYTLHTYYSVTGTVRDQELALEEKGFRVAPHPCEDGYRKMGAYRGRVSTGAIDLVFPGGTQRLSRSDVQPPELPRSPKSVDGRWHWMNRTVNSNRDEVRIEDEAWELEEGDAGLVTGQYTRTVRVFTRTGDVYSCSGDTFYSYQDRYRIRGNRRGTEFLLAEIEVEPERHPCHQRLERSLDSARGKLLGPFLELTWRGKNRQVLSFGERRTN